GQVQGFLDDLDDVVRHRLAMIRGYLPVFRAVSTLAPKPPPTSLAQSISRSAATAASRAPRNRLSDGAGRLSREAARAAAADSTSSGSSDPVSLVRHGSGSPGS